jgi:acetyl-CoA carboxylase carboxyl transferase subunit beta
MAIFGKKYFKVELDRAERRDDEALWMKCKACNELVFKKRVRENNNICPKCGEYFFLTAPERIQLVADPDSFEDISRPIVAADPLGFVDEDGTPYRRRSRRPKKRPGWPTRSSSVGRGLTGAP